MSATCHTDEASSTATKVDIVLSRRARLFGIAGHLIEHGTAMGDRVVAVREQISERDATVRPDLARRQDTIVDQLHHRRAGHVQQVAVHAVLATLAQPGRALTAPPATSRSAQDRLGQLARRILEAAAYDSARARQALELLDRSAERHALDKLIAAVAGLLVPNLVALVLTVLGIGLPLGVVAALSLPMAFAGFVLPDFLLRDEAEKRRRSFRHALSSYLDLVNVLLAGGAGLETALYAAADAGDGWGYQIIRGALRRARLTGQSPWDTFADLADRLGVTELAELSANVSLAGSHGARIRASLAAKADTLRGHQVAETEADAESATERMTVPVAVLLFGFLVFIAYPAVAQITSVSGPQP